MTKTDNHNLLMRAFSLAWRYRMQYERTGDLESVVKSENTSWRNLYRYLNLAYMRPNKVDDILSGHTPCNMEELFKIAPQYQF